ncbi:ABC transporter ATP-binding protein, partial [Rhodococcus erythropolis]|nr:ABC transporter ATP-binding protein [Rhodococcus erythropolis]
MTATDMTTDMPAGENAEKVTERELLPIASGRQTWKWLRAALAEHRMQSLLVLIVAASASAMALVPIYVFGVLVDRVRDNAPTSTIVGVVVIIA